MDTREILFLFYFFCCCQNRLFDENLRAVDKGISKIYALINGLFDDKKTAFIFTSDHGMSNKGKQSIDSK